MTTITATQQQRREPLHIPPPHQAAADIICWFWAAFPPRDGKLHVRTIADALGVSSSTIRRWIRDGDKTELDHATRIRLRQRAILRGRGHYLWPALDPESRQRAAKHLEYAQHAHDLITTDPERVPPTWHANNTLRRHDVHLVHWQAAHVYGVAVTLHDKSDARILRHGEILRTVRAPNLYAARAICELTLRTQEEHRCTAPRELIPTARTMTWLETAGEARLRRPPTSTPRKDLDHG